MTTPDPTVDGLGPDAHDKPAGAGPDAVDDITAVAAAGLGPVRAPASLLPAVLEAVGLADRYVVRPSPLGPVFVAFNANGVSACSVSGPGGAEAFEDYFSARFGRPVRPVTEGEEVPAGLLRAVEAGLAGRPARLAYDLRTLTDFGRAVLAKTAEIPAGQVRSYGWVAAEIGRPKAVRAVGTALGRNPVPLLIPCHRVVRTDGRIGDYAFGSAAKQQVLAAEGVHLALA
ncbi:MAG TPA: MGMT family protein [Acidimicrobiales bacterium]|nr:MGMT family protein [Acidimicrobiales bacterium]